MARLIPPLNPLRVFEVAARLGSFTKAADELHVSQSAVSRQISVLEDYLNVRLFDRQLRGITLTEAGLGYQKEICPAFARIASATEALSGRRGGPINLRAYTTFAAKWLLHRLPKFQAMHPDIEVRLSTFVTPIDFEKENVDVAIQFGDGTWPGASCERLFGDAITPVCSPSVAAALPLEHIEDIRQYRLLHSHYRRTDWLDWLTALGHAQLANTTDAMQFASSILTYQAATDGLGIAIGQVQLLHQEIASGCLVCPFDVIVQRRSGYYLLIPERAAVSDKVGRFCDWLRGEARAMPPLLRSLETARRIQIG